MKRLSIVLFFMLSFPSWSIQIFVNGLDGKTMTIDVELEDTVASLKEKVEKKSSIPAGIMRLIYGGKQLVDDKALIDYGIQKESTIHLLLRLRGGEAQQLLVK